tara:strand:- start:837 stop:1163 length:327 start_codon:yes stop_codon:yes gene_type:complete
MSHLKREHALSLNEVRKLRREHAAAVREVERLTREYNLFIETQGFTLVVKRSRANTKKRNKKPVEKRAERTVKRTVKKARKRKVMENDPFKPKPSLFGLHPWGDYESD